MKKIPLLCLLIIFILPCIKAEAQAIVTKVVRLEVDGKEVKDNYQIILYRQEHEVEAQRTPEGFVVPDAFRDEESIMTRVIFGRYDLFLAKIPIAQFSEDWRIGIDTKPFKREFVSPEETDKIKFVYYVSFENGQRIFKVFKDKPENHSSHRNLCEN